MRDTFLRRCLATVPFVVVGLAGCKLLIGDSSSGSKKQQQQKALVPRPLTIKTYTDTVPASVLLPAGGALWEGTSRGLVQWDAAKGSARLLRPDEGVPPGKVVALALDPQGSPWVVTPNGVGHLAGPPKPGWKSFPLPSVGDVVGIAVTADGTAWIAGDKGLVKLNKKGAWDPYLGTIAITCIASAGNDVWVGTKKNAIARIVPDKKADRVDAYGPEQGAEFEKVTELTATPNGVMAIGEGKMGQRLAFFDGFRFWSYRIEGMETKVQWLRRIGNDALIGGGQDVWTVKRSEAPGAPAGIRATTVSVAEPLPPVSGLARNDAPIVVKAPEDKNAPAAAKPAFEPPPPPPKAEKGKKKGKLADARPAEAHPAARTATQAEAHPATKTAVQTEARPAAKTATQAEAKSGSSAGGKAAAAPEGKSAEAKTTSAAGDAKGATVKPAVATASAEARPAVAKGSAAAPAPADAKRGASAKPGETKPGETKPGADKAAGAADKGKATASKGAETAPAPVEKPPAPPAPGWEIASWGTKLPEEVVSIGPDGPALYVATLFNGLLKIEPEARTEYRQNDLAADGDMLYAACDTERDCWLSTGLTHPWHFDGKLFQIDPVDPEEGAEVMMVVSPPNGGPLALSHGATDSGIRVQQKEGGRWVTRMLRDLQVPSGVPDITFATFNGTRMWLGLRYRDKDGDATDFGAAEVDLAKDDVKFHRTVGAMGAANESLLWPLPNDLTTAYFRTQTEFWFGTRGGIVRVKDGQTRRFGEADGIRVEAVHDFVDAPDRRVWAATGHGVAMWDEKKWVYAGEKDPLHNKVSSLVKDKFGWVWVGSPSGLWLVGPPDPNTADKYSIMKIDAKRGLADDHIVDLAIDRMGRVWALTAKGVSVLER